MAESYPDWQKMLEKGEIARYEQFPLFPQSFQEKDENFNIESVRKLTEWANFNFDENGRKLSKWAENTVGKGEICL